MRRAAGFGDVRDSSTDDRSVWLVGDLITVKVASEETGGALSVVEETTPPGGGPPPHAQAAEAETIYVLEGEVEFMLDGATIGGSVGSCVHLPKGAMHTFKNVGASPSKVLAVITPGDWRGSS